MIQDALYFLSHLFDTSDFPARWNCGNWASFHGWVHILSDLMIWGAYMAIPAVIISFVFKRNDVPFHGVFLLFGAFIVACGTTHLVEATIFWWPNYRISAVLKGFTAIVSWLTVFATIKVMPEALRIPGLGTMNNRLQQANTDLEDFAHVVSHDLKAPLRGIRRLAEWIDEDLEGSSPEIQEKLHLLQSRVDKMDRLINGVLEYSRVGGEDTKSRVSTALVIDEVLQCFTESQRNSIERQGVFPEVVGDETQLYQVFQNLVDNALRFCNQDSGKVLISVEQKGEEYVFCIADNGEGIKFPEPDRVFRLFHTSEEGDSTHAGIGLAIVKRTIERNGGTVWLETLPDSGTKFFFSWPKNPKVT